MNAVDYYWAESVSDRALDDIAMMRAVSGWAVEGFYRFVRGVGLTAVASPRVRLGQSMDDQVRHQHTVAAIGPVVAVPFWP